MIIEAKGIRKDFIRKGSGTNVFTAVQETDLVLDEGIVTAIRGRSGSGKSTLLNMLAGILEPTAGEVIYTNTGDRYGENAFSGAGDKRGEGVTAATESRHAENVRVSAERRHGESIPAIEADSPGKSIYAMGDEALSQFRNRHIGYIPQGTSAISSLTVEENILLPCRMRKAGSREDEEKAYARAQQLMEEMAIRHLAGEKPGKLSGGELRRMAIARAMVLSPGVILADEPTGDLDDENTAIVFEMLRRSAQQGACVLIVTHEEDVEKFADRVYRMDAGVLKAADPIAWKAADPY